MHQAVLVCGVERARHLLDDLDRRRGLDTFADQSVQVLPSTNRMAMNSSPSTSSDLVHRDHVRVLDRCGQLRLALEPLAEHRILRELGRDHLDGHEPVRPQLTGAVDHSHSAPPRDPLEAIAREDGASGQHRHRGAILPPVGTPGHHWGWSCPP